MVAWPVSLPQSPIVDGNSIAFGDNRLAFTPDVGRSGYRRRTSARDDDVSFTFEMSAAQYVDFKAFYKNDLGDGVLPFTYLNPTEGVTYTYQFKTPPQASYIKPFYLRVTLSLKQLSS